MRGILIREVLLQLCLPPLLRLLLRRQRLQWTGGATRQQDDITARYCRETCQAVICTVQRPHQRTLSGRRAVGARSWMLPSSSVLAQTLHFCIYKLVRQELC